MLNTSNIVTAALAAPIPARSGGTPSTADDSPPFAQVLGQASARQRAPAEDPGSRGRAKATADAAADAASDTAGSDDAAQRPAPEARGVAGGRGKAPGQAVTQAAKARLRSPNDTTAKAAEAVSTPQVRLAPLDAADEGASAATPFDPVSPAREVPLPSAAADGPSVSSSGTDTAPPPGLAIVAAGDAARQPAQRALDVLARPDGKLPGVPAQARAVGHRAEAMRAHGRETHTTGGDDAAPRDLTRARSAFDGAMQAGAPARAQAPADAAAEAGGHPAADLPAAAWSAITAPLAAPPAAAPAPVQADLGVAPGAREFAPALGAQLAVLVRDGVEHAQLRLNPAELGPIDVRISVDGTQAQVDFAATHALTRQALQDAVPALAGALRESGLTLSGGGVFEQPREPRGDAHANAPHGDARTADPTRDGMRDHGVGAALAARLPRARGVVDLYA